MAASTYQEYLEQTGEYGVVQEIREPLAIAQGLPDATLGEVVIFESGERGYITGLSRDAVEIVLLTRNPIRLRSKVTRTQQELTVPVGEGLRGKVVDSMGIEIDGGVSRPVAADGGEERVLETRPPTIADRTKITDQLHTGVSLVDILLPLSHGQRSVVLGDQKTGKTSFLMSLLKAQADAGTVVVYAAIGKRWRDLHRSIAYLHTKTIKENVVIMAAMPHDAPSKIITTPYAAMAVAEYFRDQGNNVVVVLDDLSTHAKFYREMSLLGKRFPGRESYPGDMFYVHARLLERAGKFKEGAITCLAVAETVNNALTSTIVSNLISITDGHLLFDTAIYNQGRHPAIDFSLSVTRVGKQVQSEVGRKLQQRITALLAKHADAERFTHFGAELSEEVQDTLSIGGQLLAFFSQPATVNVPLAVQYVMAAMIGLHWFKGISPMHVARWRACLLEQYHANSDVRGFIDDVADTQTLDELLSALPRHKDTLMGLCQVRS